MTHPDMQRVAVVGGGLAGISAALWLADAGCSVTLLEAKPRLGGLTASLRHGDLTVDTGQHVFLRCCTSYLRLLDRLGVRSLVTLQPRLDLPVIRSRDGARGRLRRGRLPVLPGLPLHLAGSLLRYPLLRDWERLSMARAVRALGKVDAGDPATDRRSFGEWLTAHGQSTATVEAVWDLIGVATLNAHADQASLALAATVFQLGLLSDAAAADLGWSRVPLQQLHGDAAGRALQSAGVDMRLRTRITGLRREEGWRLVDEAERGPAYDAVVLATDPATTERLLPAGAVFQSPGWSERLGSTPIVNVHFLLDRRVLDEPVLGCVGSPLQWLFDRTESSGAAHVVPGSQHLVASISAAENWVGRPVAELRRQLLPELHRAVPCTGDAGLVDFFVTREPHATWRQAPGTAVDRPVTVTRLPGLALAGAHTATGWPATMEGAVRSGEAAAAAVLAGAADRRLESRSLALTAPARHPLSDDSPFTSPSEDLA